MVSRGGQFPVLELLGGLLISNPQNGSLETGSVQVNKALLIQQGREATWLGACMELAVLWVVSSVPRSNMKSASGLQTEIPSEPWDPPITPLCLGTDTLNDALRGVWRRAWWSDSSLPSVPHPVVANSLDPLPPVDRGFLHSHRMEVVCVAPESTGIVTQVVCVCVCVCVCVSVRRRGLV